MLRFTRISQGGILTSIACMTLNNYQYYHLVLPKQIPFHNNHPFNISYPKKRLLGEEGVKDIAKIQEGNNGNKGYCKKIPARSTRGAQSIKYWRDHPEVHREAMCRYQQDHLQVQSAAQSVYDKGNPRMHVGRQAVQWKVKVHSGMEYNPYVSYEANRIIALATKSPNCNHSNVLKWQHQSPGICYSAGTALLPSF